MGLAEAQVEAAEFSDAAKQLAHVVDSATEQPLTLAQAHLAWGQLLAAGPERDYQQAIGHHLEAIKAAEPLKASPALAERLDALEVLLDAHLAVAPPYVVGGALVIPQGLIDRALGRRSQPVASYARDTAVVERRAVDAVLELTQGR